MHLTNLRVFLDAPRQEGELVEVVAPVDPHLKIAETHRRVIGAGGLALLFRHPSRSDFPVVTNLFGTARRVELAFGRRPVEFARTVARAAMELLPAVPSKLWEFRGPASAGVRVGLQSQSDGAVIEWMSIPPDLTRLPALPSSPDDGGPFFTLPLVDTEHPGPDGHGHNLGMSECRPMTNQRPACIGRLERVGASTTPRPKDLGATYRSRRSSEALRQ
jgi:UbiD family decarboxylase